MNTTTLKSGMLLLIVSLAGVAVAIAQNTKNNIPSTKSSKRMGDQNVKLFDEDWHFSRYGLQADGTSLPEPEGLQNPETNDAGWRKLDLPHDWAIEGPFRMELSGLTGKLPFKGIGWYRKHFTLPVEDSGKQCYIDFDGAMAYAQLWLNGQYIGTWPYGYTSFRMDLTPYLQFGKENILAVRLDTEKWDSRWYPGAGIYRHVWLVKANPVHVGHWGTYITTPEISQNSALVKMEVTLDNKGNTPAEATIQAHVFELDINNKPGTKVASFEEFKLNLEPGKSVSSVTQCTIKKNQSAGILKRPIAMLRKLR